jgi:hypothetical protein
MAFGRLDARPAVLVGARLPSVKVDTVGDAATIMLLGSQSPELVTVAVAARLVTAAAVFVGAVGESVTSGVPSGPFADVVLSAMVSVTAGVPEVESGGRTIVLEGVERVVGGSTIPDADSVGVVVGGVMSVRLTLADVVEVGGGGGGRSVMPIVLVGVGVEETSVLLPVVSPTDELVVVVVELPPRMGGSEIIGVVVVVNERTVLVVDELSPPSNGGSEITSGAEVVVAGSVVVKVDEVVTAGSDAELDVVVVVVVGIVVGASRLLTSEPMPPRSDVKPPRGSLLVVVVVGEETGGSLVVVVVAVVTGVTGPVGANKIPDDVVGSGLLELDGAAGLELESDEELLPLVGWMMELGKPLEDGSDAGESLLDGGGAMTVWVTPTVVTPLSSTELDPCNGDPT